MAPQKTKPRKTKSPHQTFIYRVKIVPDEDTFFADVPALPACYSWGYTFEEAMKNIKISAQLCLRDLSEDGEPIPIENSATLKRAPITIGVVL